MSGGWRTDGAIAEVLGIGVATTVARVRRRCVEEGLEAALNRKEQLNRRAKVLDGEAEARLVECEIVDGVSREMVRRTLKKTTLNRG